MKCDEKNPSDGKSCLINHAGKKSISHYDGSKWWHVCPTCKKPFDDYRKHTLGTWH